MAQPSHPLRNGSYVQRCWWPWGESPLPVTACLALEMVQLRDMWAALKNLIQVEGASCDEDTSELRLGSGFHSQPCRIEVRANSENPQVAGESTNEPQTKIRLKNFGEGL